LKERRASKTRPDLQNWTGRQRSARRADQAVAVAVQLAEQLDRPEEHPQPYVPRRRYDPSSGTASAGCGAANRLEGEPIPLGHRPMVKKYFELIRPTNADLPGKKDAGPEKK